MYIQFYSNDPLFPALPVIAKTILTTTSRNKGTLFKARIKSCMKLEVEQGAQVNNWRHLLQSQDGDLGQIPCHLLLLSPSTVAQKAGALGGLAKQDKGQGGAPWQLCMCQAPQDRAHVPTALRSVHCDQGIGCRVDRDHLIRPPVQDEMTTEAQGGQ